MPYIYHQRSCTIREVPSQNVVVVMEYHTDSSRIDHVKNGNIANDDAQVAQLIEAQARGQGPGGV